MNTERKFEWGANDAYSRTEILREIFHNRIYEKHYKVKSGDVVLDVGANVGAFTYSILSKNPSKVYCIEPSSTMFKTLGYNVGDNPNVILERKAIEADTTLNKKNIKGKVFIYWDDYSYDSITFKDFIEKHGITKIDFMKFDCEGGEFSIFTWGNREFIQNNITNIAGEWHFSGMDNAAERFFAFRDMFLRGRNFHVYERNGKDITHYIFDDEYIHGFIKWYNRNNAQLLVYIKNYVT